MEQMETLPPKYLKPIFIQGKNYTVRAETKIDYSAQQSSSYTAGGQTTTTTTTTTSSSSYTTGGADYTTGGVDLTSAGAGADLTSAGAGADLTTGGADYTAGADFTTGATVASTSAVDYTASGADLTTGGADYTAGADLTAGAGLDTAGSTYQATTTNTTTSSTYSTGATGSVGSGVQPVYKLYRQGAGISHTEEKGIVNTAISILQQGLLPVSNTTAAAIKRKLGGDWLVIYYPQGKAIDFNMTCVQGNDYMYFTLDNNAYQVCRLR